jgi:ABC-type methionine transport system permease subunit
MAILGFIVFVLIGTFLVVVIALNALANSVCGDRYGSGDAILPLIGAGAAFVLAFFCATSF